MNENDTKCEYCGSPVIRSHTCEEYLIWECSNPSCANTSELESFCDMSDESWEWVKRYMRESRKSDS
jgi:hypothetical protein